MQTLGGAVKLLAKQVQDSSNPADLRYGVVSKVNPLEVHITSTFILPEQLLIVPERLTDHQVQISHACNYNGTVNSTCTFYNALKVGDRVALLRESGGRKYFILDRF